LQHVRVVPFPLFEILRHDGAVITGWKVSDRVAASSVRVDAPWELGLGSWEL
jgi:hypothetical protein